MDHQVNEIMQNSSGWSCVIFELDSINPGGLLISYDSFMDMETNLPNEMHLRFYRKSKKITIYSEGLAEKDYAFGKFAYNHWKCEICKKISLRTEKQCFCGKDSFCWTPVNPVLSGVHFNDDLNFKYHFQDIYTLNIID